MLKKTKIESDQASTPNGVRENFSSKIMPLASMVSACLQDKSSLKLIEKSRHSLSKEEQKVSVDFLMELDLIVEFGISAENSVQIKRNAAVARKIGRYPLVLRNAIVQSHH